MTGTEIITLFETLMDDTIELSATEELALADRIYKEICMSPLECLKKTASGVLSTSLPYVALPADFLFIPDNLDGENSKNVYLDNSPMKIVSFADRRKEQGAYIDVANSRLVFTEQPTKASAYSFDYIYIPADLTLNTSPVFPVRHEAIAYGMAVDSYIIQQFDKARSYMEENQAKYDRAIEDLKFYNSQLIIL